MSEASPGHAQWWIPDCYWPEDSAPGAYPSHESICVINTGRRDASLRLTFFFEDRPPCEAGASCPAERTRHIRLDTLLGASGEPLLPRGKPYAARLNSDVPVIVQYSRCDSSHPSVTLMTTMAFPAPC